MSAQTTPYLTQPEALLPLPISDWQPGQTVRDFLQSLRARGYVLVQTWEGVRMIRKH